MTSPPIIGLNWKMNPADRDQTAALIAGMGERLSVMRSSQLILFPPAVFLDQVRALQKEYGVFVSLGVQDLSTQAVGSYTGEISAPMAFDSGAEFSLVGHSETRKRQALTDTEVKHKFERATEHSVVPILCIGYQEGSEEGDVNYDVIKQQVMTVLEDYRAYIREHGLIIAYEPTWAIGTGDPADPETIETVCLYIQKLIAELAGQDTLDEVYVLYGGSVNKDNVRAFLDITSLNGFLLGGASLKPEEVASIVEQVEEK